MPSLLLALVLADALHAGAICGPVLRRSEAQIGQRYSLASAPSGNVRQLHPLVACDGSDAAITRPRGAKLLDQAPYLG
jgi:hypothetical protein